MGSERDLYRLEGVLDGDMAQVGGDRWYMRSGGMWVPCSSEGKQRQQTLEAVPSRPLVSMSREELLEKIRELQAECSCGARKKAGTA